MANPAGLLGNALTDKSGQCIFHLSWPVSTAFRGDAENRQHTDNSAALLAFATGPETIFFLVGGMARGLMFQQLGMVTGFCMPLLWPLESS